MQGDDLMPTRRQVALGAVAIAASAAVAAVATSRFAKSSASAAASETFEVNHTPEEWKKLLTPEQFSVLREADTEQPFTSPLNHEKGDGTFVCAGCDLPLFSSKTKFDSGTGWPSFYTPIEDAVRVSDDWSFGMARSEVHCRRCGGHLGHVFDDGPPPTGKRYCMNGVAMKFEAA
jgi:peptide-methionine (R)-S-oxide reductase